MEHRGGRFVLFSVLAAGLMACMLDDRPDPVGPPLVPEPAPRELPAAQSQSFDAGPQMPPLTAAAPSTPPVMPALLDAALPPPVVVVTTEQDDAGAPPAPVATQPPDCTTSPCAPPSTAATTTFTDIPSRLTLILNDLESLEPGPVRQDARYLDLTNYANAGHAADQLELYRGALSYAMNTLSRTAKVIPPHAVDTQSLLFRIQLSDYGWTQASWEQLVADYPYGVTYDPNSRTFPIDTTQLTRMRSVTATSTPYIQADWFFSHAIRPPLYYDLLGVPDSLGQLEQQLGVDIQADIDAQRVSRAGFQDSGPSHFNRVIERHALGEDRGVLWLTYDFEAGTGLSNIITHPLDFRASSSEILFSLANGLHGYMIVDGRGTRLAKAPNAAVQDAHANDFAIEAGISCNNCHLETGVNVQHDEVRGATTLSATDLDTANAILALYKDDATLDAQFATDGMRYRAALAAVQARTFTDGSAHALDDAYADLLGSQDIAGLLGIRDQQLTAAITGSPGIFPPEVLALRAPGKKLPRDQVDAIFGQLVTALGLGSPQRP